METSEMDHKSWSPSKADAGYESAQGIFEKGK